MIELIRTNDAVLLSFAESLMKEAGIHCLIADQGMSILEGSLGMLPRRFLVEGDTGAEVTLLQTQLNRLAQRDSALPSVTADGIFGAATAAAVRTLQSRLGYSPTGAVGPVLWSYIITQGQGYGVF